jgi:hypothetical protein
MSGFSGTEDTELLDLWDQETDFNKRDEILEELQSRGLFPGNFMKQWEDDTGAYPSIEDPEFLRIIFTGEIFKVSLIFSENVLKKRSETKVIIGEKNS